ncbi:Uncharacterised protein [Mannheimia haemolytica]|uniref:Uncharacterized protein n=1 Tax=Mannheimia haemolytica TaxID=75985 RepID=A0A378N728_MANHA|nr:Uncharacterised protein [Mannheimia haemolytica]
MSNDNMALLAAASYVDFSVIKDPQRFSGALTEKCLLHKSKNLLIPMN